MYLYVKLVCFFQQVCKIGWILHVLLPKNQNNNNIIVIPDGYGMRTRLDKFVGMPPPKSAY